MTPLPNEISQLLAEWSGGDRKALDELMPLVYEELQRLAHRPHGARAGRKHAANNRVGQRSLSAAD